ncbi:hypothetical protein CLOM_g22019 [Closterium sp. NIES-68]|nr:hypothetical protein CLOM_g22019 [Closterium sp. NIES-68]GJP64250.1 hypothetical protein CLOP_g21261 [Closterium sp. NIES-67]GJP77801.1 hypothetical protein CLOP_g8143 [Closterium sp. NIES-67]
MRELKVSEKVCEDIHGKRHAEALCKLAENEEEIRVLQVQQAAAQDFQSALAKLDSGLEETFHEKNLLSHQLKEHQDTITRFEELELLSGGKHPADLLKEEAAQLFDLKQVLKHKQACLSQCGDSLAEVERELALTKNATKSLEEEKSGYKPREELLSRLQDLQAELQRQTQEQYGMKRKESAFKTQLEVLKAQLGRLEPTDLKFPAWPLHSVFRFKTDPKIGCSKFLTALDVIAGQISSTCIVESMHDAKSLLDLWEDLRHPSMFSRIWPLKSLVVDDRGHDQSFVKEEFQDGSVVLPLDLLEFDHHFRPALAKLFSSFVIARDDTVAADLALKHGIRSVTLDGKIHKRGFLSGGWRGSRAPRVMVTKFEHDRVENEVQKTALCVAQSGQELKHLALEVEKVQQDLSRLDAMLGETRALERKESELLQNTEEEDALIPDDMDLDSNVLVEPEAEWKALLHRISKLKHAKVSEQERKAFGERMSTLKMFKDRAASIVTSMKVLNDGISRAKSKVVMVNKDTYDRVKSSFQNLCQHLLPNKSVNLIQLGETVEDGIKIAFSNSQAPDDSAMSWNTNLNQLSGGQRTLLSVALVLAIAQCSQNFVYLMDEVDAALDEENQSRVGALVQSELAKKGQVLCVSHNRAFQAFADSVVQVTMDNGSKISYAQLESGKRAKHMDS